MLKDDILKLKKEKNAVILHLAGEAKPWKYINGLSYQEWEYYFKRSEFKDIELIRKKKRNHIELLKRKAGFNKKNEFEVKYTFMGITIIKKIIKREGHMIYVLGKTKL